MIQLTSQPLAISARVWVSSVREHFICALAAVAAAIFPDGVFPHIDPAAAACLACIDRLDRSAGNPLDTSVLVKDHINRRIRFRLNRLIVAARIGRVLPEGDNPTANAVLFRSLFLLRNDAAPALPGLRAYLATVPKSSLTGDHIRGLIAWLRKGDLPEP